MNNWYTQLALKTNIDVADAIHFIVCTLLVAAFCISSNLNLLMLMK